MAARVYDIYDLNSVFVEPTAPVQPTTTAKADANTNARLMRGAASLLTLAGALLLTALLVTVTPLGRIDADITVPFLAVFVGGLAAIAWAVLR